MTHIIMIMQQLIKNVISLTQYDTLSMLVIKILIGD